MLSTSPSRPAVCRSIRFSCSDSLTVTQPLPDRDSISFLRCYQAHNYSHARLQMSVSLCQFSPVRICVSTPHRCLSLQTVQAAAHENFHPCLHLKGSFGCTIASHVRVVKSKASILFYFISVDSFLFLCVCFVTVSLGRGGSGRVVAAVVATPRSLGFGEVFRMKYGCCCAPRPLFCVAGT